MLSITVDLLQTNLLMLIVRGLW